MDEGNYKKITYKNSLLIRQNLIGLQCTLFRFYGDNGAKPIILVLQFLGYFILIEDSLTISSVFKTITSG